MIYSGINKDGTLKKFSTPIPTTTAAKAASSGDLTTLQSLSKTEILSIDEYGNNALIWAADKGHSNIIEYLLVLLVNEDEDKGIRGTSRINHKGYLGNTALSRACRGGHTECVKLLISQRMIDPNVCNEKMQFPLHFGAFKKHEETVKVLLESGKCNTLVKDRKGRTPVEDTSVQDIKDMILRYREEKQ